MPTYHGTFQDRFGTESICIENDFNTLSVELRGLIFEGSSFDDLCLKDKNNFCIEKLAKSFEFESFTSEYLQLSNYQLYFKIPIIFIEIATKKEREIDVNVYFELKTGYESCKISFDLEQQHLEVSNGFLEIVFDQIQHQLKGKYRFENCYGCLYADYSVYGQGFMGSMLCYKNQKENYLEVKNKSEYMQLAPTERQTQEIFCCSDYQIRDREVGYRGFVE